VPFGNKVQHDFRALNLSARKSLWNKKASISIAEEDVFNESSTTSPGGIATKTTFSDYRHEPRLFTFGFRYRSGNTAIKGRRKNNSVEERRRV